MLKCTVLCGQGREEERKRASQKRGILVVITVGKGERERAILRSKSCYEMARKTRRIGSSQDRTWPHGGEEMIPRGSLPSFLRNNERPGELKSQESTTTL